MIKTFQLGIEGIHLIYLCLNKVLSGGNCIGKYKKRCCLDLDLDLRSVYAKRTDTVWLIDNMVFYAVSAIFWPYNDRLEGS